MAIVVESKYGILRIVSVIYKIFAVIVAIIGLISGLGAMVATSSFGPGVSTGAILTGLMTIVMGLLGGVFLWAGAEMIILFIDIEENTRRTSLLIQKDKVLD